MKTFHYFLISVLIFAGCKKQINNEITVTGHLQSADIKEIYLKSDDLTFKAPVDSNGTFILKFAVDQPRIYRLNDDLNLFLIPGDSIIINKDGEAYKFSGGQSAVLSNYYLDWEKYWSKLTENFDEEKYFSQEPDDFTRTIYQYIDTSKVPLNELSKKITDIDPEFIRLENERLKYWMIIDFLPYEYQMYKHYTGKEPDINDSFYNYMKDVNLNDSTLLQLESYKDFLITYTNYNSKKELQNNTELSKDKYSETDFILNFICKEFTNQRVLDYVLYKIIYDRTNDLRMNEKNLAAFKENCRNEDFIENVDKRYQELQVLMPGQPAPDFTLYDANNKEYKLSDFKGKYLLIDVWGVFCQPCIREMPYLKQIEQDYKNKNIEFVCICLEKDPALWLKRVGELNLTGIQLIDKGGRESQFRKGYKIYWTPTYILIDAEGKFIDARAPRPSENLRDLLDKSL